MTSKQEMKKYIIALVEKVENEKILQRIWKILEREYLNQVCG